MHPTIYLHIQHRPWSGDYGAVADLDGDGKIEEGERETDMVRGYVSHCARCLALERLQVAVIDPARDDTWPRRYSAVHASLQPHTGVYVACHANAGGGDYGLVQHDTRSRLGEATARVMAYHLGELAELASAKVRGVYDDRYTRVGSEWRDEMGRRSWLYRGFGCIKGIYPHRNIHAVLVEPFFLDRHEHHELATEDGLKRVGEAVAAGLAKAVRARWPNA